MKKLDTALNNGINNKDQCNDAIEYEPKFDNKFSLSSGTKDTLSVVTTILRGVNKHGATIIYGLTCLWDSRATERIIKKLHTKPYDLKICSIEVEYSTSEGPYCTIHEAKVPYFMLDFSSSKIISHQFHVDHNEGESGISFEMIIGRDLMVQLGILAEFKHKILQWDGAKVPMKEPSCMLGKTDITSHEMCEVVIQTKEPVSTK